MSERQQLKIAFNATLMDGDSENTTYGCRANNPDICSSNSLEGVCAFVTEDHICKKPSRAWKNQYNKLLNTTL